MFFCISKWQHLHRQRQNKLLYIALIKKQDNCTIKQQYTQKQYTNLPSIKDTLQKKLK